MNILYVHRTRGSGAEGIHIREIVRILRENHTVQMISAPGSDPFAIINNKEKNKSRISKMMNLFSKNSPQFIFEAAELLYNIYIYLKCIQAHQAKKIDFIYERYALNTFAAVLFAKRNCIPIILEINDATGIERSRENKFKLIAKIVENWIFSNADHLLTISSEFKQILISRGVPSEKCSFQPNAVNLRRFDLSRVNSDKIRTKFGLSDKIVIGFVGSFAKWHGIELLYNVIPKILEKNDNVIFLLVGDGVSFKPFSKWIDKYQFNNSVVLTGQIHADDVPEYVAAMDVGLIPNSNQYGSPMKLFEYLSVGVVPVVPDFKPMRDVVENCKTALFFPPKDINAMIEQLEKIINDNVLRRKISLNAREITRKYTWEHNVSKILSIARKLINDRKIDYRLGRNAVSLEE